MFRRGDTYHRPKIIAIQYLFLQDSNWPLFKQSSGEEMSFPNFVERSWNRPSPSSVLCPLLYRTEQFLRGEKRAEKRYREKGRRRGWPANKAKRKKDAWKQVSEIYCTTLHTVTNICSEILVMLEMLRRKYKNHIWNSGHVRKNYSDYIITSWEYIHTHNCTKKSPQSPKTSQRVSPVPSGAMGPKVRKESKTTQKLVRITSFKGA